MLSAADMALIWFWERVDLSVEWVSIATSPERTKNEPLRIQDHSVVIKGNKNRDDAIK